MAEKPTSPMDEVRMVLLGAERDEMTRLQQRVDQLEAELAGRIEELATITNRLEELILPPDGRTAAVSEILVDAVEDADRQGDRFATALQPDIEQAINTSARVDSAVLAEALYPVMGPAMRKMIADMFTIGDSKSGSSFVVSQVLLIERETGLLLASSSRGDERGDADVVSGMLDAIRLFVQEAFDADEHDGLRELRVGDTSVQVEWGPRAVLATVARGLPTEQFRIQSAQTLEEIHFNYAPALTEFSGDVSGFEAVVPMLDELEHRATKSSAKKSPWLAFAALVVLIVLIVLLIIWIV